MTGEEKNKEAAAETAEETVNTEETIEEVVEEAAEETTEEAAEEKEEEKEPETEEVEGEEVKVEEPGQEKHRFFGRKPKKDKKDEKIEELTDRVVRQMAEFDNYRKRTEKEKAANYDVGAREVIEKLLPVLDNFERGFAGADMNDPFVQGMDKIYKQLMTILENMGVTVIEAKGKEFDLNLHNAVMHVEDESVGENIVVEEFQKGYMYKDTVVRHSMVKVAN